LARRRIDFPLAGAARVTGGIADPPQCASMRGWGEGLRGVLQDSQGHLGEHGN
jgi:hypothetical protein